MTNKAVTAQRDFSAGEIDVTMKRDDDDPIFKTGLRQCANFRILDTKKLANRIGRTALFIDGPRVDEVLMSPGNVFKLCFSAATLTVRNAAGASVFTQGGFPWAANTVNQIVWDVYGLNIYICFPGMQPQVLTWDGVSTWSVAAFAETVTAGGQKRTFFYRISPQNVTMQPSNNTWATSVTLTFSSPIAVAGMVGTRMRYVGRQLLITGFTNATTLTATVEEALPGSQTLTFGVDPATAFSVGDVVLGSVTGSKGIVISINSGAKTMVVQLTTTNISIQSNIAGVAILAFTTSDVVAGSGGGLTPTVASTIGVPQAVSVWDEEVMNSFRGWPSSVTVDQGRLCFMDFPSVPSGIGYSAIGVFTDLYVPFTDVVPSNAIFEIAPNKSQVLFMVPGMEGSEFIFCDNAIYYFPITLSQPLSATSGVAFNLLTRDGCASVQPKLIQEAVVFVSAGGSTVRAITATGAFQRPYEVRPISILHDHLFKSPITIAAPSATDPNFPERYIYVLNNDGTLAQGKLKVQDGQIQGAVGWVSMSGVGVVKWVSARAADVIFTATYAPNSITPVTIAEINDATQFMDGCLSYNSVPAALTPPGGKGPLWWLAGGTVTVMDQSTRQMGLYQIDANGFLIPQFQGGENLSSAQLVTGQAWTATAEPFVPSAQPGQDIGQRTSKRRISRFAVNYQNSTGFLMARLFSGPLRPAGPALGTIMNFFRVLTYNQDDDPTQPPPLREGVDRWRPSGRSYDPRAAVIKDTAGPLNILELDIEATM